jgi:hypothetical protein
MLRVRAFLYMFLGASLAGVALCIIGVLIGAAVLRGDIAGFGALVGGLMGGILGFPVGAIVGIILVHRFFHYNGSVWFGIIGCIIGAAIVIGLAGPLHLNSNMDVLALCFLLAPPVLGTTGYFLGVRVKKKKGLS